jgi:hypothetical protein
MLVTVILYSVNWEKYIRLKSVINSATVVNKFRFGVTFISRLMHSIIQNVDVKIHVIYKFKRHIIKNYSNMFRITNDPSSGSDNPYFDWNYLLWFINVYHVHGRCLEAYSLPVVCVCVRCNATHTHTHTHHRFRICRQTPTTHMTNICEPLQVISVTVRVITPWWLILCDPKHVGVIFNYVSFKLLYDTEFNIYVLYKWVH